MNQLSVIGILCLSAGLAAMGCSSPATPAPATNAGTSDLDASAPPAESIGDGGTTAEQEVPAIGAADAAVLGGWHPGSGDGGATTGPDASGPVVQTITATVGPI